MASGDFISTLEPGDNAVSISRPSAQNQKPAPSLLPYGRWQTPGPLHTKLPTEGNSAIISVLSGQFQASIEVAMGLWDLPKEA